MLIYFFIYTLIGFTFAYFIIPNEPSLFERHFYFKSTLFILTWPISCIAYLVILANL